MARELYTIFKVLQKENFIRNVNKNHQIWLKVNAPHTKTEDMLIDTFGPLVPCGCLIEKKEIINFLEEDHPTIIPNKFCFNWSSGYVLSRRFGHKPVRP
jgi:hypothetical protein